MIPSHCGTKPVQSIQFWQFISSYYGSPGLTLHIFPLPVTLQDIFLYLTMPQDSVESIYEVDRADTFDK